MTWCVSCGFCDAFFEGSWNTWIFLMKYSDFGVNRTFAVEIPARRLLWGE